MAGLVEKLARKLGYAPMRRGFDAGIASRITASWPTADLGINSALWSSLAQMRARSRELAKNDSYAKRFLAMVRTNVAGPNGMLLQSTAMTPSPTGDAVPDRVANIIIEREWNKWARRGSCDVTGRLSLTALLNLYVTSLARDGEVLVRRVRGADNRHGYALQFLDVARLDEQYNVDLPGGNVVRMSVELDPIGRPVAYWVKRYAPKDDVAGGTWASREPVSRQRIAADEMWHDFLQDDPEQIRGVPWMHAAMIKLYQLGKFEEAAVVAARVGAGKVGVIQSPTGEPPEAVATGKDSTGNFLTDSEPGQYWTLPSGYELRSWDPAYPSDAFDPFLQSCLRGISSALNVSYVSLANNLEGVNYSSIRQGVLEEREYWKALQGHITGGFLQRIYRDWLETSLLRGALDPLPFQKIEKWDAAQWRCKRWAWVDPLKDREESVLAINNGLKTRAQVCAEEGLDFEDVLTELAAEQKMIEKWGVEIAKPATPGTSAQGAAMETENAAAN